MNSTRSTAVSTISTVTSKRSRKRIDDLVDQDLRRRSPGGDADRADAVDGAPVDVGGALDELRIGAAGAAADLDQPAGVRRVRRADHQQRVDVRRHRLDRLLPVRGGVADVFLVRPDDRREAVAQRRDDLGRVVDAERRLGDEGEPLGIADLKGGDVLRRLDQEDLARRKLAHRALGFGVAGMADHHHLAPLLGVARGLDMDLGDERAGGVDVDHVAPPCLGRDGLWDTVRGEDDRPVVGRLLELLDEDGALVTQAVDDVAVMHDLVPDIDGCAPFLERHLDDLDGAIDAGAESARRGEIEGERRLGHRLGGVSIQGGLVQCRSRGKRPWQPAAGQVLCDGPGRDPGEREVAPGLGERDKGEE